ncbi:MAG: hypothetical protein KF819_25070 [Labilithrix sp.]|nr:hypothetical protein [Labilithrix sp.]
MATLSFGALLAGCGSEDLPIADCNDDKVVCPTSSKTATKVGCACTCDTGPFSNEYSSTIPVCITPDLNPKTGSPQQQVDLRELEQKTYDQRIFQQCSVRTADFLTRILKDQLDRNTNTCLAPVFCECTTKGSDRRIDPMQLAV